ncbi:hypothetical protein PPACK8108_LOCUS13984 [Phakopsora pachyrhizi]|uniref:Uncharacterized protein n=1 Tax=Phakopsora pachyrhizi TaxID=170000 RepID=A0AAV0B4C6_PHAPC|nr:hypothetical protein PPACK8108_LOCUS13984 [Phakopsora pachyrhizi]
MLEVAVQEMDSEETIKFYLALMDPYKEFGVFEGGAQGERLQRSLQSTQSGASRENAEPLGHPQDCWQPTPQIRISGYQSQHKDYPML